MLETCASMTFPDFQRQMEWCQSYFTTMSLKAYAKDIWVLYYYGYLMCNNFGHLTKFIFQCNFKCKTYLARYHHQYLICEESSHTMTWYEKKRFLRTNKKFPFWWYPA